MRKKNAIFFYHMHCHQLMRIFESEVSCVGMEQLPDLILSRGLEVYHT